MTTKHVAILPYDEQWKQDFLMIKDELTSALGQLTTGIEHVGSTSVEGLSAVPVIDIDVIIKDYSVLEELVSALEAIGFKYERDHNVAKRETFRHNGEEHLREHHLYVCPEDSPVLKKHIAFRDYLRSHSEAVQEYSRIKEEGAKLYPDDAEKYYEHNASFIEKIYSEIGI